MSKRLYWLVFANNKPQRFSNIFPHSPYLPKDKGLEHMFRDLSDMAKED